MTNIKKNISVSTDVWFLYYLKYRFYNVNDKSKHKFYYLDN